MMRKTQREFTEEFKREAVLLLESSGRPLMQVAKELGSSHRCCGTGGREIMDQLGWLQDKGALAK